MGFKAALPVILSFLLISSIQAKVGDTQILSFESDTFGLEKSTNPYFNISEVSITEVKTPSEFYLNNTMLETAGTVDKAVKVIALIDKIVALGQKIWSIVEKGKAVVKMDVNRKIDVVPLSNENKALEVFELENWTYPETKSFAVVYKNGFGSKVIQFTYTVYYQHSGQYNGKGSYLANVNVTASNVSVKWGFDFNANSEFGSLTNVGSLDDPIAGVTFNINYVASSVFSNVRAANSFFVSGKGDLKALK